MQCRINSHLNCRPREKTASAEDSSHSLPSFSYLFFFLHSQTIYCLITHSRSCLNALMLLAWIDFLWNILPELYVLHLLWNIFLPNIFSLKKKKNQQSFSRPSLISSYPNLSKWSLQGWREIPSKISLIYFHLSHWVEFYTQASRCSLLCISKNTPRASSRIVQSACTQISQ